MAIKLWPVGRLLYAVVTEGRPLASPSDTGLDEAVEDHGGLVEDRVHPVWQPPAGPAPGAVGGVVPKLDVDGNPPVDGRG